MVFQGGGSPISFCPAMLRQNIQIHFLAGKRIKGDGLCLVGFTWWND
jgi:hypothetical protein